jgi:KDO2-lipid IV(A) lauroyltransferase
MTAPSAEAAPGAVANALMLAWKVAAYHVLRHLPAEFVSAFGGGLVRWSVPRHRPDVLAGALANLRRLKPDLSDADIERLAFQFLDNVGRVMAEFALLPRLHEEGRILVDERYENTLTNLRGPAIVVGLHTGNWEVGAALPRYGVRFASLSVMLEDQAERAIAARVRARLGVEVYPATLAGLRGAMRWLESGEGPRALSIYGDEARGGALQAPLFGRPAHAAGNLALIAKLARRSGARLLQYHVTRTAGCRFVLTGSELLPLPEGNTLEQDVAHLNALIEPIIRDHLDQWYFLDNRF